MRGVIIVLGFGGGDYSGVEVFSMFFGVLEEDLGE